MMYRQDGHLAPFRADQLCDPVVFRFDRAETLPAPCGKCVAVQPNFRQYHHGDTQVRYLGQTDDDWRNAYLRVEYGQENLALVRSDRLPDRLGTHTVLEALAAEHLITRNSGVLLHCAYIGWQKQAILFTAPSGTGKSTQAALWQQFRGAEIINGDRAAIRHLNGKLYAEGVPFSGSSPYCKNVTLPLRAVVCLSQAPVTSIRKMRGYEAFSRIWEGIGVQTWDKADVEAASALVKTVAETIPVYYLPCTPDETAVLALEQALEG